VDTKSAFCLDLGVVQAGVGEGGAQAGGGAVGEGDHAAVLAQSTSVKKAQPAFQMHRDLNAAWNLWNVLSCLVSI
jgi:hypothetical protein